MMICIAAKPMMAMPPTSPITLAYWLATVDVKSPAASRIISGSSTTVWPYATFRPALAPCHVPYSMLVKKRGPGAKTPDAEMAITSTPKSSRSGIAVS